MRGALRRLAALPLAAEILISYAQARLAMRGRELPAALARLRSRSAAGRVWAALPIVQCDGARLGAAVDRTLSLLPFDVLCLTRALVLLRVLSRRGAEGDLVIAVLPERELELSAHAWVELDSVPLLRPAGPEFGRLVTL